MSNQNPLAPPPGTLLGRTTSELEELVTSLGQPRYRGRQIAEWLYQAGVADFGAMSNLPAALRGQLAERFELGRSRLVTAQVAGDGTRKLLLELGDGECIEAVALPYADRLSTCVSSQTGCAVGCTFCATGYLGAGRNLTAGEMVDQVLTAGQEAGRRVSHVVFMGMGEPLLNLGQVLRAVHLLHTELGLSERHITISTVGLPPQIEQLAEADLNVTLALSLHAAEDSLRRQLIPTTAQKWTVAEVVAAARSYAKRTGRRLTYEIVLLAGVNDGPEQARAVARRLRPGEHVNLIPYNPVSEADYGRPTPEAVRQFRRLLEEPGLVVTQRQTRGRDIDGACGQLRAATPPPT